MELLSQTLIENRVHMYIYFEVRTPSRVLNNALASPMFRGEYMYSTFQVCGYFMPILEYACDNLLPTIAYRLIIIQDATFNMVAYR